MCVCVCWSGYVCKCVTPSECVRLFLSVRTKECDVSFGLTVLLFVPMPPDDIYTLCLGDVQVWVCVCVWQRDRSVYLISSAETPFKVQLSNRMPVWTPASLWICAAAKGFSEQEQTQVDVWELKEPSCRCINVSVSPPVDPSEGLKTIQ